MTKTNYNYIINPRTGKKVSIHGNLGRKIIKNYLKQVGGLDYGPDSPGYSPSSPKSPIYKGPGFFTEIQKYFRPKKGKKRGKKSSKKTKKRRNKSKKTKSPQGSPQGIQLESLRKERNSPRSPVDYRPSELEPERLQELLDELAK